MTEPCAVVVGATGQVGRGLVPRLLARGFRVLAQGRDELRLAALREAAAADPRLVTVQCGLASDADVGVLAAAVAAQPVRPSVAVATLGGWYIGPELAELPTGTWAGTLAANLTTHFVAARGVAPALGGAEPVYLMLNGIASLEPCVGSGAISVAGAGQTMLVAMLRAETIGSRVRFRQLTVLGDIALVRPEGDRPGWIGIDRVADAVVRLLADSAAPDDLTISAPDAGTG